MYTCVSIKNSKFISRLEKCKIKGILYTLCSEHPEMRTSLLTDVSVYYKFTPEMRTPL